MTKWVIPDTPSPEAIVRAALEMAADKLDCVDCCGACDDPTNCYAKEAEAFRRLASDREQVAAIIKAAGEDRG